MQSNYKMTFVNNEKNLQVSA